MQNDKIWDEMRIRQEITRLDQLTGLHGADLPITFGNARYTLGSFHIDPKTRKPLKFHFSRYFYENPDWSTKSALDTIRHEYAHYMDYVLNGNMGHGPSWKGCCCKLGASPTRLYNHEMEYLYKKQEVQQKMVCEQLNHFQPDSKIRHPKFGTGVIKTIRGTDENKILEIDFGTIGVKKLGGSWVNENCKLL